MAVFGSSQTAPGSAEWADAEGVGAALARAGLAVITGGYGGSMEAASKGADEAGGRTIGVTAPPLFPGRTGANPFVQLELKAETLAGRIGEMMARADGALALPGSIGTAAELLIAWNTNHIVRRNTGRRVPTVAVGARWGAVAGALVDHVEALPGDIHLAETATEAVAWLLGELGIH